MLPAFRRGRCGSLVVPVPVAGRAQANQVYISGFVVFRQGQVWPFAQRLNVVDRNAPLIYRGRFVCAIPAAAALVL